MTTELEQEFFKVFGIEPKIYETDGRDIDDNGDVCSWYIEEVYPEITDRRLLEMICIFSQHCNFGRWNKYAMHSIDDFEYQITILKTDNDEYSSENADPIKAFLTCVLKCVSNDEDTVGYIRETEWK